MANTNLHNDMCYIQKRLNQSTGSFGYMMYPGKYYNNSKCRIELGQVGGNGVSLYNGNLIDLESDLKGYTRPASLCPSQKYQPSCKKCPNCSLGLPCGCLECRPKLLNQPSCQMILKRPVIPAPAFKASTCNGAPFNS